MLNILFYGGDGWIGQLLADEYAKQLKKDRTKFLITKSTLRIEPGNEERLRREIRGADRVICSIGRTCGVGPDDKFINSIDYMETRLTGSDLHLKPLLENVRDNLYGVILLAQLCKDERKHMLYIGTGCLFNWNTREDHELAIDDDHATFYGSSYAIIKGFTDSLCRVYDNVCNCRLRMPIVNFDHPKNLITKLISYSKIHDMPNSVSYLPALLPIMVHMSLYEATGTYNMTSPGSVSHSQIIELYKQHINPNHTYEVLQDAKELNLLSTRSNTILCTEQVEEYCKTHLHQIIPSIQTSLELCMKTYNKAKLD